MIALIDLEDPFDVDLVDEAPAAVAPKRPRAVMPRRKRAAIVRPPTGARCPHSTQSGADPRGCTMCLGVAVERVVTVEPITVAALVAVEPITVAALVDPEPKPVGRTRAPTPDPPSPAGLISLTEICTAAGEPLSRSTRGRVRIALNAAGIEPTGKLRRAGPSCDLFDRTQVESWLASRRVTDTGAQP